MEPIEVTAENSEDLAEKIIQRLNGRELIVVSFYTNTFLVKAPHVLDHVHVSGNYSFENGRMKIQLEPKRSITWDVAKETVSISFPEEEVIIILRVVTQTEAIQRVIISMS